MIDKFMTTIHATSIHRNSLLEASIEYQWTSTQLESTLNNHVALNCLNR